MLAEELPGWYVRGFAFALGAVWGSFANVVIYRWPRELSVVSPPSHCFACGAPVRGYDNVPIVSYLLLRGRCRSCRARYSPRYAVVELLFGVVSMAIAERLFFGHASATAEPLSALAAAGHWAARFSAAFALLVTAFIDLDEMLVPWFTKLFAAGPLLAAALLPAAAPTPGLAGAAVGAAVGYAGLRLLFIDGYKLLTGRRGMGLGDAEVLLLVGALLGLPGVLFTLGAGALQGLLATLVVVLFRGRIGPANADEVEDDDDDESDEGDDDEREGAEGEASATTAATTEQGLAGAPAADGAAAPAGPATDAPSAAGTAPRRVPLKVPFVPFLALAALEYLLGADALVNAYVRTLTGE